MIFFKNADLYTTNLTEVKNDIGQIIKTYVKDALYRVNKQPIDEKTYKYTWGNDIKSNIQVYADVNLNVEDIVIIDNIVYKVEKKIVWNDYFLYALLDCDVGVP